MDCINLIPNKTKELLINLADKYENSSFIIEDPSQFLYHYKNPCDIELCAFVASMLSFGSRKQFIPKINFILELADDEKVGGIYNWITTRQFEKIFAISDNQQFYRFYSYKDMYYLFDCLFVILQQEETLGIFFSIKYLEHNKNVDLIDLIPQYFANSKIVPQTKSSCKKRLCMFLRWMVRTNSPVDLGLWTWYEQDKLLIPVDVHVLQIAKKLSLIEQKATATRKTAELLTQIAKNIFPTDPAKLDFALFGLGVDDKKKI